MNIKVSIPLSYLDGLIRDNEQLNLACENYEGDIRKLRAELAECKKAVILKENVPNKEELEIRRLFLWTYTSDNLSSHYSRIRRMLHVYSHVQNEQVLLVRIITGCTLEAATSFVEGSDERLLCPRIHDNDSEIKDLFAQAKGRADCCDYFEKIRTLLVNEFGQSDKIGRIKKVRQLTGCSLKKAKDFIERTHNPVNGL